ncbi:MAG: hypothetical protein NT091_03015, partial [Candidatus Falkowbacteria bacterium]|nr:hypothetical protein [Candidatus Falkowbacteria bacterium]
LILGTIFACLLLFYFNTSRVQEIKKAAVVKVDNTGLIQTITQKQNQVDANLLYNNEINAKTILAEIDTLINSASTTLNADPAFIKLLEAHNLQLGKIRHASDIDSAQKIASFKELNAEADPSNIILVGDSIYVGDSKQKTIYTVNLGNNLATAVLNIKEPITNLKYPIKNNNNDIYYLNDKNSLVKLTTKTGEISLLKINLKDLDYDSIKGGSAFGSNIYYISGGTDNQIFKFTSTGKSGFGPASKWIKEKGLDVSNAIAMDIDGYIYVLKGNGEILKMQYGRSEPFTLEKVEPELKMATKFIISREKDFIYILDPLQKRLVVFSKTGKFVAQYASSKLTTLKDFVVDEKSKVLYFLDKDAIYKISATHIK